MPHIYSSLSESQQYTSWKMNPTGDVQVKDEQVFIKGGKGKPILINGNHSGVNQEDPVVTEVTDDQLILLRANPVFQLHVKEKFIAIVEGSKVDPKKVKDDLAPKDQSAQKTPDEFKGDGSNVKTNAKFHSAGKIEA